MTPEEHQLITGLFERMRALGPIEKDRDAESVIMQSVLGTPDAAYKLVQTVLVQESALEESATRMQDMEERIRQLESGGQTQARPASGGFLGGLFGGGSRPVAAPPAPAMRRTSSVPASGGRPMGYGQQPQGGNPWGPQAAGNQQGAPAQGGGFMKSAMATAAGVAGGMLVANAIGSMLGGSSAQAATGQAGAGDNALGQSGGGKGEASDDQAASSNDPGNYEQDQTGAQDEGGGGWFGGDSGGDDTEF